MTIRLASLPVFLGVLLVTASARAEVDSDPRNIDVAVSTSEWSVGARIGGYGFRRNESSQGDERNSWDLCRMNGIGIFVQRALGRGFFLETGLDLYFSESWPFQPTTTDSPLDRTSALSISGVGYRTQIVRASRPTRSSVPVSNSPTLRCPTTPRRSMRCECCRSGSSDLVPTSGSPPEPISA